MKLSEEEALIADIILNRDYEDFTNEEIYEAAEHEYGIKCDMKTIDGVIHYLYQVDLLEASRCPLTRDMFA